MIEFVHKIASELSERELSDVKNIFNADQTHQSEDDKAKFEDQWLGPYLKDHPKDSHFFLAQESDGETIGYLLGTTNSHSFVKSFEDRVKVYSLYEDLFDDYPAHLHINLSPKCRGKGVGSQLMTKFLDFLKSEKVKGIHLVTSKAARNVSFYEKNGFSFRSERTPKSHTFLFLGQQL